MSFSRARAGFRRRSPSKHLRVTRRAAARTLLATVLAALSCPLAQTAAATPSQAWAANISATVEEGSVWLATPPLSRRSMQLPLKITSSQGSGTVSATEVYLHAGPHPIYGASSFLEIQRGTTIRALGQLFPTPCTVTCLVAPPDSKPPSLIASPGASLILGTTGDVAPVLPATWTLRRRGGSYTVVQGGQTAEISEPTSGVTGASVQQSYQYNISAVGPASVYASLPCGTTQNDGVGQVDLRGPGMSQTMSCQDIFVTQERTSGKGRTSLIGTISSLETLGVRTRLALLPLR